MTDEHEALIDAIIDGTEAQEYRNQSLAHLDDGGAIVGGLADAVLAVTPESFNDGADVLAVARGDLREAHTRLTDARTDGAAAVAALREATEDLG